MVKYSLQLLALLEYVTSQGRVCPKPTFWNRFWELLPRRFGAKAPMPLILGAWHVTNAKQKQQVLREQIEYAAREGVLDAADAYLRGLKPDEWSDGDRL